MPSATEANYNDVRDQFRALGQEHVFRYWSELSAEEQGSLLAQACALLPVLPDALKGVKEQPTGQQTGQVTPLSGAIALPCDDASRATREEAETRGREVLVQGRVAALVVAGGQGTRLGFGGPKGQYPLGPVTDRTLFRIQGQKLRGLAARCGRTVPWYVMTSPATDEATREAFLKEEFFGLDPGDVFFFCQGTAPSLDFDGRLLLSDRDRIVESPNGHGGVLPALVESGALDDMEQRGINLISYYQVDNPLVQIGDPAYLGYHEIAAAEMSCKVIRKRDPVAKVGVVAEVSGRVAMLEYTELPDALQNERDERGNLVYWAGNIAMHVLTTGFVRRVARNASEDLPFHASAKVIPHLDEEGRKQQPNDANGYKLERFVFDALPVAERTCVLEVDPALEFSPVKNAEGSESPASAREALVDQYRAWLEAAALPAPPANRLLEIDHSYIDNLDDARALAQASDSNGQGFMCLGPEVTP